jgi:hypothetical protein
MEKKFYVYVHRRETDGSVFYVGKGTGRRAWSFLNRNPYWKRIANKQGFTVNILVKNINEVCAFSIEKALIKLYGRQSLSNMTNGGEGPSGFHHSEKTKADLRGPRPNANPWLKGKSVPEYLKIKLRDVKLGTKQSPEHAEKSRKNKLGVKVADTSKMNLEKRRPIKNNLGEVFDSAAGAARQVSARLGINASQGNISMVANGHRKKAYSLEWSYMDKNDVSPE